MSTSPSRTCPTCGMEIPADAPSGLCAMCMLTLEDEPETVLVQPDLPAVPGYQLLALLGEGAFARVFHAQSTTDSSMGVAVKVLKDTPFHTEGHARFRSEIAALKRLRHPNIAQIFDWGQTRDGHPFLAMELIDGMPLDRYVRRKKPELNERLSLFLDLCEAVRHAHQSGILHRDLKPENILVSHAPGGDPVLKVIDLGIAKAMEEPLTTDAATTRMRMVIGTPGYMSPEQRTPGEHVDVRSDVFSLGVILHFMLTGNLPNAAPPSEQAGAVFQSAEPRSRLPQDLEWIIARATKPTPAERYQSADALASDIRRFMEGRPVEARPPSSLYQLTKWAGRHKVAAVLAILLSIIVPSAAIVSTLLYQRAESRRKQLSRALAQADFLVGVEAQNVDDHRRAMAHFAAAIRSDPDHTAAVGQIMHTLAYDPIMRLAAAPLRMSGLKGEPSAMAVSPSGQRVAVTDGHQVLLLDSISDQTTDVIDGPINGQIFTLALNDTHLALGMEDGRLFVHGPEGLVDTGQQFTGSIGRIQINDDDTRLLASSRNEARVLSIPDFSLVWSNERPLPIFEIVSNANIDHVLMIREGGRIRALHHASLLPSPRDPEMPFRSPAVTLSLSDNGRFIGIGSFKQIFVGQMIPGSKPIIRTIDIQNACTALCFSQDTRIVVASTKDGNVRAWTVDAQAPVASQTQHLAGAKQVALLNDQDQVLSISRDNHVRIWNLADGQGDRLAVAPASAWVHFQPKGRTVTSFDPESGGLKRYTLGRESLPLEEIEDTGWEALPRLNEDDVRGVRQNRNITFATRLPSGITFIALADGHLRFWSPALNPMSPQLPLPGNLVGITTDPNEDWLLMRFADGVVRRLRLPPSARAPGWLASYAELTARARLRPDRNYVTPKGIAQPPTSDDSFASFLREQCSQ